MHVPLKSWVWPGDEATAVVECITVLIGIGYIGPLQTLNTYHAS